MEDCREWHKVESRAFDILYAEMEGKLIRYADNTELGGICNTRGDRNGIPEQ